jgi:hypothetical protein
MEGRVSVSEPGHYSVALEPNDEQWWPGKCNCGYDAGMFPTAEDACDALMEHAFAEGYVAATPMERENA